MSLPLSTAAASGTCEWSNLDRPRYTQGCLHCQRLTQSIRRSSSEPDLFTFSRLTEWRTQNVKDSSDQTQSHSPSIVRRPHLPHRPATDVPHAQRLDTSSQDQFEPAVHGRPVAELAKWRKTSITWADELTGACLVHHNHIRFPKDLRSEVVDSTVWNAKHKFHHDSYFQGSPYWTLDDECDRKDDNQAWLRKIRN